LYVTLARGAYANSDLTGSLQPDDFWLFDKGNNNPRTIESVVHTPGEATAVLTLSAPLQASDIGVDLLATRNLSAWAWYEGGYVNWATGTIGEKVVSGGPWPSAISKACPDETLFDLDEEAASSTVTGTADVIVGSVNDAAESLPGDGLFHGDGVDNYVNFDENPNCFSSADAMTLEVRVKPALVDAGGSFTVQRVFSRDSNQNYQLSVWRNSGGNFAGLFDPPAGVASFGFWLSTEDKHDGAWWKLVLTDYDACPIVSNHWYTVRVVWNSAKEGGIPADIYVDDQGSGGLDADEAWPDYVNCTDADQSQIPAANKLYEGDTMMVGQGPTALGVNVNNNSKKLLIGFIDWFSWKSEADYEGVADAP